MPSKQINLKNKRFGKLLLLSSTKDINIMKKDLQEKNFIKLCEEVANYAGYF